VAGDKSVRLMLLGDNSDARIKIDAIDKAADELIARHPELTIGINSAKAQEELSILRAEMKTIGDEAVAAGDKSAAMGAKSAAGADIAEKAWGVAKLAILGVGAAIGFGVVKAAGFEQAMEHIHTQAGVAQSKLAGLGQGVLQLAGQVGQNPDSLAEALYHVASNMASMGATSQQELSAVKIAAEGASVGGANLVDVTNALGAAIASGIPGVQNYQSAMGALNATVGAGDMHMQDLAEAMGTGFLSNVKIYGSTLNDVGAILATFGDNNIRGAHAGTQLRVSVQSIAVQAKTAGPALKQLGLQVGELGQYQAIHGTVATINLLTQKMKEAGITSTEQGNIITQLFGKKAGAGVAVLVDQVDRLNSKTKVLEEGSKTFGAAWQAQTQTTQQQFNDLKDGADALAISLGIKLLPAALDVMKALNGFMQLMQHNAVAAGILGGILGTILAGIVLKKMEDGLKGAVEGFEGLWHGMGDVAKNAEKLLVKMGILTAETDAQAVATADAAVAQEGLNLAWFASPIGLIVIGIVAVVAAFVILWEKSAAFRDFWIAVWHDIIVVAKVAWGWLKDAFGAAEGIFMPIVHGAEDVIKVFDRIKNFITSSFDSWWASNGKEIEQVWTVLWTIISSVFETNWKIVTTAVQWGWDIVKTVFSLGMVFVTAEWKLFWTVISTEAKIGWTVVTTILKIGWLLIQATWDTFTSAISTAWRVAWGIISNVAKTAWDAVAALLKIGWDLIVGVFDVALALVTGHWGKAWNDIKQTASQVWNAINAFLGQAIGNMKSAVLTGVDAILGFFGSIPGRVMGLLGNMGSLLFNAGKAILEGFLQGLESAWNDVTSFVGGIGSWIASHKGPIEVDAVLLRPHGKAIMGGLVGGLQDGMPGLTAQLARTTNVIANTGVASSVGSPGSSAGMTAEWIGGAGADQEFITWLKKNIRIRGGDPAVLGR
jgi:TP901 family phage tail tape measure protein